MSKDFIVEAQIRVPDGTTISAKPVYLLTLTELKDSQQRRFLSLDLPGMHEAYVQAKGFYCPYLEEEIIADYKNLVQSANKDSILELYLPWHSIVSIRSLVFKAK